jgi:hypothetical protein
MNRRVACVNEQCENYHVVRTVTLLELGTNIGLYSVPVLRCQCGTEPAQVPAAAGQRLGPLGETLPGLRHFAGILPANRLTVAGPVRVGWLRKVLVDPRFAAAVRIGGHLLSESPTVDVTRDQLLEGDAVPTLVQALGALRDADATAFEAAAFATDPRYPGAL